MRATVNRIIKDVDERTTGVLEVSFDDEGFKCTMLAAFDEKFFEIGKETYIDLCLYPDEYRICKEEYGFSEMIVPSDRYKDGMPYNTIRARVKAIDQLCNEQYIYITCFGKDLNLMCSKDAGETIHKGDLIEAKCWCEVCEGEPDVTKDEFCMYMYQVKGLELHDFREYFDNERRIQKFCEANSSDTKEEREQFKILCDRRLELMYKLKEKAFELHNDYHENDDLETVLGCLTDKEEVLIRTKLGIDDGIKRDLKETADKLGIDQSTAEIIEKRALKKLNVPEKKRVIKHYLENSNSR